MLIISRTLYYQSAPAAESREQSREQRTEQRHIMEELQRLFWPQKPCECLAATSTRVTKGCREAKGRRKQVAKKKSTNRSQQDQACLLTGCIGHEVKGQYTNVRSHARLLYRCMALSPGQRVRAKKLSSKAKSCVL